VVAAFWQALPWLPVHSFRFKPFPSLHVLSGLPGSKDLNMDLVTGDKQDVVHEAGMHIYFVFTLLTLKEAQD
jgi:hypothetical protein